jgi:disulfide bond formation protein DsbB
MRLLAKVSSSCALLNRTRANALGFLSCAAMMGFALYQQYGLGHEPCHLCILQRISVIALGVLFLGAALHRPRRTGARVYAALLVLCALGGLLAAGRNVWVQMQPEGSIPACGAPLNVLLQMLPLREALMKVFWSGGDCQAIVFSLFGVSLAGWVFVALSAMASWAVYWNFCRANAGTASMKHS